MAEAAIKLVKAIMESGLPAELKLTTVAFVTFASPTGEDIFPAVGRVAWLAGTSSRTVQRHLERLRNELRVLDPQRESRGGRRAGGSGKTTRYRFCVERLPPRPAYQPRRPRRSLEHTNHDAHVAQATLTPVTRNHDIGVARTLTPVTRNHDIGVARSSKDLPADLPKTLPARAPASPVALLSQKTAEQYVQQVIEDVPSERRGLIHANTSGLKLKVRKKCEEAGLGFEQALVDAAIAQALGTAPAAKRRLA